MFQRNKKNKQLRLYPIFLKKNQYWLIKSKRKWVKKRKECQSILTFQAHDPSH
jgi:hypothetical protein